MPRGGARPGAGRKPKIRPPGEEASAKKAKPAATPKPAGYSPKGVKVEGAPAQWPFGTETPTTAAAPAPAPTPAAQPEEDTSQLMPLEYMLKLVRDSEQDPRTRLQAAIQAAPYCHAKVGEGSKKKALEDSAKAASSRFGARPPPQGPAKLKVVGG